MDNETKQEKYMNDLFERYFFQIESYAKIEFDRVILPWIKKYNLEFYSGMGDFFFRYTKTTPKWFVQKYRLYEWNNPNCPLDNDKIPVYLRKILNSIIPGNNFFLGSLMPDWSIE